MNVPASEQRGAETLADLGRPVEPLTRTFPVAGERIGGSQALEQQAEILVGLVVLEHVVCLLQHRDRLVEAPLPTHDEGESAQDLCRSVRAAN